MTLRLEIGGYSLRLELEISVARNWQNWGRVGVCHK